MMTVWLTKIYVEKFHETDANNVNNVNLEKCG